MIETVQGNVLAADAQALINAVHCAGVIEVPGDTQRVQHAWVSI